MKKFFDQVDLDKDGKVSDIEIKEYIAQKEKLRSKYEKERQGKMEKTKHTKFANDEIDDYVKDIFKALGKTLQYFVKINI